MRASFVHIPLGKTKRAFVVERESILLSHIDATLNHVTLPIRSLNLTSSLRRFPLFFIPLNGVFLSVNNNIKVAK